MNVGVPLVGALLGGSALAAYITARSQRHVTDAQEDQMRATAIKVSSEVFKDSTDELRRLLEGARVRIAELEQRIKLLEEQLQSTTERLTDTQVDLRAARDERDQLRGELEIVRGRHDELEARLGGRRETD